MAVPKRKTSKAKGRSRRAANWKLALPARSVCPQCATSKLPHIAGPNGGWFKNRNPVHAN